MIGTSVMKELIFFIKMILCSLNGGKKSGEIVTTHFPKIPGKSKGKTTICSIYEGTFSNISFVTTVSLLSLRNASELLSFPVPFMIYWKIDSTLASCSIVSNAVWLIL